MTDETSSDIEIAYDQTAAEIKAVAEDVASISTPEADVALAKAAEPEADWSVLEDERITAVAQTVAGKLARDYNAVTDPDDEYHEAVTHAAKNSERAFGYLQDPLLGERALYRWLHQTGTKRLRDNGLIAWQNNATSLVVVGEE